MCKTKSTQNRQSLLKLLVCVVFVLCYLSGFLDSSVWAINDSVPRARNELPETDSIKKAGGGNVTIGLRGDAPTHDVTQQAWIGIWEADSNTARAKQNGVNSDHPSLTSRFFANGRFDASDGDPTDEYGHGTGVAGIILSTDTIFEGMAPKAHGAAGMFDDAMRLHPNKRDTCNKDHWTETRQAGNRLESYPCNVINGSWGINRKPKPGDPNKGISIVQADLNGSSFLSKLVDKYGFVDDRVIVMAAGNNGDGSGTRNGLLNIPADHFNGLTVGALVDVAGQGMNIVRVAKYSSYLPLAGGRNGVHLVAPGSNIWSTAHDHGGTNKFIGIGNGTSFAAPHVSGAAGILWSAGEQAMDKNCRTDHDDPFANDHRLIKALLINSARKIPGAREGDPSPPTKWEPGEVDPTNNKHWLHPLNYVVGSGELDTHEAWLEYREKPEWHGVKYENRWWDEYFFTPSTIEVVYITNIFDDFILPDDHWITDMTITLCWDRHITDPETAALGLSNLDLSFLYSSPDDVGNWVEILASVSSNDSTEHIFLEDMKKYGDDVDYQINVSNSGLAAGISLENYALAVHYWTIPEPSTLLLLCLGGLALVRRLKKSVN